MSKIIAIANQKGGVGKTTTALNLGAALSLKNKNILLIDLDPQANLSEYLKFEESDNTKTINDIMFATVSNVGIKIEDCILPNIANKLDFIPADINLCQADFYMSQAIARERIIKKILLHECFAQYDYIIIDCVPSLGILLINALACADGLIIPVQTQKFALDGLQGLMQVFNQVKENVNQNLKLIGVLATMIENTNMSKSTTDKLHNMYGEDMFKTAISKSVEAAYSSENGVSLCLNKQSKLGAEYINLADEIIGRCG